MVWWCGVVMVKNLFSVLGLLGLVQAPTLQRSIPANSTVFYIKRSWFLQIKGKMIKGVFENFLFRKWGCEAPNGPIWV
jgi:hypothetical protein